MRASIPVGLIVVACVHNNYNGYWCYAYLLVHLYYEYVNRCFLTSNKNRREQQVRYLFSKSALNYNSFLYIKTL